VTFGSTVAQIFARPKKGFLSQFTCEYLAIHRVENSENFSTS